MLIDQLAEQRKAAVDLLRGALVEIQNDSGFGAHSRMRGIARRAVATADELLSRPADDWRR